MAPVPLPGVRGHLVRQRQPARHSEALGQPLLLAAVPYEGVAEEAFPFSRRHGVTPACDAIGHHARPPFAVFAARRNTTWHQLAGRPDPGPHYTSLPKILTEYAEQLARDIECPRHSP